MIEATAQQRLSRAANHNTRPALEQFKYKPGDMVDIWFEPATKDHRGWRGPATVSSVSAEEGHVTVRMQGRTIDRMAAEVREHIAYLVFASNIFDDHYNHLILATHCFTTPHTFYFHVSTSLR